MQSVRRLLFALLVVASVGFAASPVEELTLDKNGRSIYIVTLTDPPAATFERSDQISDGKRALDLEPTSITVTGERRLDAKSKAVLRYTAYLHDRQNEVLALAATQFARSLQPKFRYDLVLNGFAVALTPTEAAVLSKIAGVASVSPDRTYQMLTDAGPTWIGAPVVWNGAVTGAPAIRTKGEGVVVGIIDTGINFAHPSFQDIAGDGFNHTNPRGQRYGECALGHPGCNDKLIGIFDFTNELCAGELSPRGTDCNGHGSHVAGITAGNEVTAPWAFNTATYNIVYSGVAPRANLVTFKICIGSGATGS